jgi:hypothetical protein
MRYHPVARMRLPNAAQAMVEVEKLRDYCLSPVHARGRHKARVLTNVLGIRREHAAFLRKTLLEAALTSDVTLGERDAYGQLRARLFYDRPGWDCNGAKHLDCSVQ